MFDIKICAHSLEKYRKERQGEGWVHLQVIWQLNWKYCVEVFQFMNSDNVLFGSKNKQMEDDGRNVSDQSYS